jgi:glucose/arabinose dehydrogenase
VAPLAALAALPMAAQTMTDANLQVTAVVPPGSGLSLPTTMAFLGPGDFLVLEKATGRVRRVVGGVLQLNPVLDVPVNSSSERGMLGIAIQPGSPPQVFLYYTEAAGSDGGSPIGNRVYRYNWDAGTGTLVNGQLILDLPVQGGPNHDGGVLALDSAGRLYALIGDLNRNGQLQNNAGGSPPDDTSVVLRVDADGSAAAGNPFTPYCSVTTTQTCASDADCPGGQTCRTEVARYYAYGIRNGFGLAFDRATGALWDTENGPSTYDEVNLIAPGFNSGWNPIMGPDARDPQGTGDLFNMPGAGLTYSDPEFSWLDTNAPTAIFFPVGSSWGTAYDRSALVADANNGNIYALPVNASRTGLDLAALPAALQDLVADDVTEQNLLRIGSGFSSLTDLERGPDNHVYAVSIGAGAIYRIAGPVSDLIFRDGMGV